MMNQNYGGIAEAFYTAFGKKNIEAMDLYLHPDVQLITPMATQKGKKAYLEAAQNFSSFFNALTVRSTVSEGNQAVVIYDVDCPEPIGKNPAAALLTFHGGLITRVELFHDTSPFQKVKDELLA